MKISRITTTRVKSLANLLWVEVHTEDGLVGLGETFRGTEAVEAYIHSIAAPMLLGQDALQTERHNRALLRGYLGFNGSGVETRAASALDIAFWDLKGKAFGQPVWQLLGGLCHDKMRAYNTCAGVNFNSGGEQRRVIVPGMTKPKGRYDDQVAFLESPVELAQSLIEEGFSAMKIWPADSFAAASHGQYISSRDIRSAVAPFEKIRAAVGDRIELMCEFHSLWNTTSALALAKPLRDLNLFWAEDPIKMDSPQALADYRRLSGLPVCGSETLAATSNFRDHLAADALDYVMLDLSWCGGITEAKKIAALAEAYQKPIAPHDCTGPVVLTASLHLGLSCTNAIFQEVVRAYLADFYGDLVSVLPTLEQGWLLPPTAPGLGTELNEKLRQRDDVVTRSSTLSQ